MHSQIIPNTDFPACAKTYCPFYTEQCAIVIYYTWKIFPVRQWDMWRCIMCDMITISFPIFCPDKCYFTSFTTKEYTHCYCVPCEGYGCWEARGRGRGRERETSSWAQSPLSWAVLCTAHYTVQADTAGLGDWGVSDRELARPEARAAIWAVSRQYLLLFPRPRLLWLSLWLSVTECDSVTGVTRDSEIVRKIHLNSSTFYKTPPK